MRAGTTLKQSLQKCVLSGEFKKRFCKQNFFCHDVVKSKISEDEHLNTFFFLNSCLSLMRFNRRCQFALWLL